MSSPAATSFLVARPVLQGLDILRAGHDGRAGLLPMPICDRACIPVTHAAGGNRRIFVPASTPGNAGELIALALEGHA